MHWYHLISSAVNTVNNSLTFNLHLFVQTWHNDNMYCKRSAKRNCVFAQHFASRRCISSLIALSSCFQNVSKSYEVNRSIFTNGVKVQDWGADLSAPLPWLGSSIERIMRTHFVRTHNIGESKSNYCNKNYTQLVMERVGMNFRDTNIDQKNKEKQSVKSLR